MSESAGVSNADAEFFTRRYNWLVIAAWMIPALFGLGFIAYIKVLSVEQLIGILITPTEPAFILISLLLARWYLVHYVRPVTDYLTNSGQATELKAIRVIGGFPVRFWFLFLFYLLLAPASVILSAEHYTDYVAQPVDWFRIHLVALIVSIIVGLPIFFMLYDLFGRVLSGVNFSRPYITVKTKVFLIGALVPLLIDTMLVQYYWTRTGYFSFETFIVWLVLELLAVAGSLLFLRSFQQSLGPLQKLLSHNVIDNKQISNDISPQSTDELGILTQQYRSLLDESMVQHRMLDLNNRMLRHTSESRSYAYMLEYIIETCEEAFDEDMIFLMLYDEEQHELVGHVQTGEVYSDSGYFRLALDDTTLAVWTFNHAETAVVTDVFNDPRVKPEMRERFKVKSALGVPLIIDGEVIGVLMAIRQKIKHAYTRHEVMFLEGVTKDIAHVVRSERAKIAHNEAEKKIKHMAHHDALTGLVNRYEFEHRLNLLLDEMDSDTHHALLYIDLDQFKIINDTCGHTAGDELLRHLAHVLKTQVRENDTLARLGGDEFGVLLENCPREGAQRIAEGLLDAVSNFRFSWQEKSFSVGASIGMTLIDDTYSSPVEVLSAADVACYTAKDMGRNRINLYQHDDADVSRRRGEMEWVSRIQSALEEGRFKLFKQFIVPLDESQGRGKYCEFLVRMYEEDGELIIPGAFIPAAERYNLMTNVDRWVIRHVMEFIAGPQSSIKQGELAFINLSGLSINDGNIASYIREQIHANGIDPGKICFEITETAAISSFNEAYNFIEEIHELGCKFALDDFGAGMSSFSYLKALPVDYLKIDGDFIRNMDKEPMNYEIVKAVNNIGHAAGLTTIAEFVETDSVMDSLREIGVDYVQGYIIDKPCEII